MGTYTSLAGAVRIKKEYTDLVSKFANYEYSDYMENETKRNEEKYLFVKEFFKTDHADWIPNNNPLSTYFDEEFFKNRFEDGIWYFSSDLKNYEDETTGLSPIQSFFENILENVAEEILLLETSSDYRSAIAQYNFSDDRKIIQINYIDLERNTTPTYGWMAEDEEDIIDAFESYKRKNKLDVYNIYK